MYAVHNRPASYSDILLMLYSLKLEQSITPRWNGWRYGLSIE
nr:MAG TPA: hypothetical protein [Caudoviricetes sp.]